MDALASVLQQEPILKRLKEVQQLSQVGSSGAMLQYQRIIDVFGEEDADTLITAHILQSRVAPEMKAIPADLLDSIETVASWLVALTASDVSLMIAIHFSSDQHSLHSCRLQSAAGMAPGTTRTRGGDLVVYRVAVVDVVPKPARKVKEHFERNNNLVEKAKKGYREI